MSDEREVGARRRPTEGPTRDRPRPGWLVVATYLRPASLAALSSAPLPARAATRRLLIQKRYLRVISGGSVSVTLKKPNTAGNLIVAYVVWDNAGSVSVSDSAGNTFASAIGPTQATGDASSAQIFYATNIAGGPNKIGRAHV